VALDELAGERAISLGGSSARRVFQNRFPKAGRFAQAHASRDHRLVNALAEMSADLRHNLLAEIRPTVEHRHDNTVEFELRVHP